MMKIRSAGLCVSVGMIAACASAPNDTFDWIYDQAMMMADALSDGVIRQFPTRF